MKLRRFPKFRRTVVSLRTIALKVLGSFENIRRAFESRGCSPVGTVLAEHE